MATKKKKKLTLSDLRKVKGGRPYACEKFYTAEDSNCSKTQHDEKEGASARLTTASK